MGFWGITGAFVLGVSRGGLKGLGALFILLLALEFGAKPTTGIVVPLLIITDIFALFFYRKFIVKRILWEFLPPVLVGVLIGVWIGKDLPEFWFKRILGGLVVAGLLIMWMWDFYYNSKVKSNKYLNMFLGLGSGVYTMLGNFAGAFTTIYFLLTRLPKKELIGTVTCIFFIVNVIKIPFHIWVWDTISTQSLRTDLYLFPITIVGFFVGLAITHRVSERHFRQFLYIVTILGAILVFVR